MQGNPSIRRCSDWIKHACRSNFVIAALGCIIVGCSEKPKPRLPPQVQTTEGWREERKSEFETAMKEIESNPKLSPQQKEKDKAAVKASYEERVRAFDREINK